MKKSSSSRLLILVLVLTMITASLVAGTYAKYTTTVTATDTVSVANWEANLTGNTTDGATGTVDSTYETNFLLFETAWSDSGTAWSDSGVDGELLAPGTSGRFSLSYDTDASEVARNVTIKLDANSVLETLPQLKFYKDAAYATEITPDSGILTLLDQNYGPAADGSGTVTVYWKWAFYVNPDVDTDDTADGVNPLKSQTLTATFTATQLDEFEGTIG